METLLPPTSYQGGKQRISKQIVDIILNDYKGQPIYDLCCGSAAISIELINRSALLPTSLTLVDQSPWGLFWKHIGEGSFDLDIFKSYCDNVPKDVSKIQNYIKELSKLPANVDTTYVYLLLQAASFGSKAIWISNNKWMNCSFRSYWLPTKTSNRTSPVNPLMPMPNTLFQRIETIVKKMKGVLGYCKDVWDVPIPEDAIVYIDPPYINSTAYGFDLDVLKYVKYIPNKCYVSESYPLSNKCFQITSNRKKGGISGERKSKNEEWLSRFN